jgi:hypothetical protein
LDECKNERKSDSSSFSKKPSKEMSGTREPEKEPVVLGRLFDLLKFLGTAVNHGNRVFVDETLAKLSLNKVCLLYTQWPCHSFNMNNEYCMIILIIVRGKFLFLKNKIKFKIYFNVHYHHHVVVIKEYFIMIYFSKKFNFTLVNKGEGTQDKVGSPIGPHCFEMFPLVWALHIINNEVNLIVSLKTK